MNAAQKLISSHLTEGVMEPGEPITLHFDQTLTQDATGTLVMLALQGMEMDRARTEISAQYVDHNLLQLDEKNAEDHAFLRTSCQRYGVWFSRPGNGVSHPVHMQRFGRPGKALVGSDSHTCAAGALGMLAVGMGGMDVAQAMAGQPVALTMPAVWGIKLEGRLPPWVSAKDVILELLRRHDVDGGKGRIIEYWGPGVAALRAMDRHVIANMGQELGATTTVFPSDEETRRFLESEGRGDDWSPIAADSDAGYDVEEEIDLSTLVPLIAKPSSPGNVVPVDELAGQSISQAYIGSSANPGYRDFAIAAQIVAGRTVAGGVSFDINPTSRQLLLMLIRDGHLSSLIGAGARLHQAGCNGCIGMGQAPATGQNSLRTTPRNFPGRSGAADDRVFLCSPETAAASALRGAITDPRSLDMPCPEVDVPERTRVNTELLERPLPPEDSRMVRITKGPNIASIPRLDAPGRRLALPVILKVGDDLSTDEILPAGADVLPLRSNIPAIADYAFKPVDDRYADTARHCEAGHAIIGGTNYGQGSSREHAALAPRFLGLKLVIAKDFSRIHKQNLVNFGVLPLTFRRQADYDAISTDDRIVIKDLADGLRNNSLEATVSNGNDQTIALQHDLTDRQVDILLAGGLINWLQDGSGMPPP